MRNNVIRFTISTVINIIYFVFFWFIGYDINAPVYHSRKYYICILVICGVIVAFIHLLVNIMLKNIKVSDSLSKVFVVYTIAGIIPFFWLLSVGIIFSPIGIVIGVIGVVQRKLK